MRERPPEPPRKLNPRVPRDLEVICLRQAAVPGETATETERQVIAEEPVPPGRLNPKVPRDLETICLKCLHKDPQRRYATAAALADDLRRFGEGRPIQARPLGWAGRLWRWVRRKPAAAALVAMALALVGLALGGGLWLERQRAEQRAETARQEGRAAAGSGGRAREGGGPASSRVAGRRRGRRWRGAEVCWAPRPLTDLRERLRQASADADMVAELEEIRLRLSEGRKSREKPSRSPEEMYADAFRKYGIPLMTLEPAEAAARVRDSIDPRDARWRSCTIGSTGCPMPIVARPQAVVDRAAGRTNGGERSGRPWRSRTTRS